MKIKSIIGPILLGAIWIINLTKLPVFADEAIYIRWAQIISSDFTQLFLPMYDGKTPFFIWMIIPFLSLFRDPLFAARIISVIGGIVATITLIQITNHFNKYKYNSLMVSGLMLLPFPFFHYRMGLIDGWLTSWLAISILFFYRWQQQLNYQNLIGSAFFWGLAFLTKSSAIYMIPAYFGLLIYQFSPKPKELLIYWKQFAMAIIVGVCMVLFLRISQWFPFLFQRSGDFAHTPKEIVTQFPQILIKNVPRVIKWLGFYLTPSAGLAILITLMPRFGLKKILLPQLLAAGLFVLPFLVTGKLLATRYFLPIIVFAIPIYAIIINKLLMKHRVLSLSLAGLIILFSLWFDLPILINPTKTPFIREDEVQYLTEWSAGYGIPEVRAYISQRLVDRQVVVATEGFFGTLPDGLMIYFANSPLIKNLELYGIGQPIAGLDPQLVEKAKKSEVYLVVNEHRFDIKTPPPNMKLVATYPRPRNGPALMLWQIFP